MKKYLILLLFCFIAAETYVDVLNLQNGDIIKGQIIENSINNYIKIELAGGSILTFQYSDIKEIKKELIQTTNSNSEKPTPNCYGTGKMMGNRISTGGTTIGAFASGFFLGWIGMGIHYGITALGNPQPQYIPDEFQSADCYPSFINGYKEGALRKKKLASAIGGAAGYGAFLVVYIAAISASY